MDHPQDPPDARPALEPWTIGYQGQARLCSTLYDEGCATVVAGVERAVALGIVPDPRAHGEGKCVLVDVAAGADEPREIAERFVARHGLYRWSHDDAVSALTETLAAYASARASDPAKPSIDREANARVFCEDLGADPNDWEHYVPALDGVLERAGARP